MGIPCEIISNHYEYELFIRVHHKQAQCILDVAWSFLTEAQPGPLWELPEFLLASSFSSPAHTFWKAVPAAAARVRTSVITNLHSCLDSHAGIGSSVLSGNFKLAEPSNQQYNDNTVEFMLLCLPSTGIALATVNVKYKLKIDNNDL